MKESFQLDLPGQLTAQQAWKNLLARLNRPLGPAVLLGLERIDVDGNLRRADQLWKKDKLPAVDLRPIAKIQVLRQRVVLPAAGGHNRLAAPDAGRPVEIKKAA